MERKRQQALSHDLMRKRNFQFKSKTNVSKSVSAKRRLVKNIQSVSNGLDTGISVFSQVKRGKCNNCARKYLLKSIGAQHPSQ